MNGFNELSPAVLNYPGLGWIRFIQSFAFPPLTGVMKIVTSLVSEYVFLALLPFFYWRNEKKGFPLGVLMLFSFWLNELLKELFRTPRPFHLESGLGMIYEGGWGFPSGHAQLSLSLLIPLALWLDKKQKESRELSADQKHNEGGKSNPVRGEGFRILLWAVTVLLILLIAFSRLYLGVHFPQDILGGWFFGGLLLFCFFFLQSSFFHRFESSGAGKKAAELFRPGSLRPPLVFTALISFLMIALVPQNILPGAVFLGFSSGYVLKKNFFTQAIRKNALFFLAGLAGAVLIYGGLKILFPPGSFQYGLFRFIRYALLGFWISGGVYGVFKKLPPVKGS